MKLNEVKMSYGKCKITREKAIPFWRDTIDRQRKHVFEHELCAVYIE